MKKGTGGSISVYYSLDAGSGSLQGSFLYMHMPCISTIAACDESIICAFKI